MNEIFYLTITIWAITGSWMAWQFGFRRLLLDNFRDELFATRDRLYRLAQEGKVSCDAEGYRAMETLINNLIRYAHRLTLSSLTLSRMQENHDVIAEQNPLFADEVRSKICAVENTEAREELSKIFGHIGKLIPRYAAKSSLLFLILSAIYFTVRAFSPVFAISKKTQAVIAFERDVYYASDTDGYARA